MISIHGVGCDKVWINSPRRLTAIDSQSKYKKAWIYGIESAKKPERRFDYNEQSLKLNVEKELIEKS